MVLRPCITCGQPGEQTRCTGCQTEQEKTYAKAPKSSATSRGYDNRWRTLSLRARRIQPWCSDCGSDQNLTADHSPEAWRRFEAGLPIRLQDIDVVCIACNIDRGSARPGGMRSSRHAATRAGEAKFVNENGSQL